MAATLSYTGTPTGLATDLSLYEDVLKPSHLTLNVNPADLESLPDEIRQLVDVFQQLWGNQIGSGKRLEFSVTIRLLELMLQAYKGIGLPRSGDRTA